MWLDFSSGTVNDIPSPFLSLVPAKLVCDWKTLFIAGRSLYGEEWEEGGGEDGASEAQTRSSVGSEPQPEGDSEQLLDNRDLHEYRVSQPHLSSTDQHNFISYTHTHTPTLQRALVEWEPPEALADQLPRPPNPMLSHAVYRLLDMVDPPQPPPTPPSFPRTLLRACAIGKPFSGKTTTLKRLAESESTRLHPRLIIGVHQWVSCTGMGVHVLSVEELIFKAVQAYQAERKVLKMGGSPANQGINETPPTLGQTPSISVEPSSCVQMDSGAGTAGGEDSTSQPHLDSADLLPQVQPELSRIE